MDPFFNIVELEQGFLFFGSIFHWHLIQKATFSIISLFQGVYKVHKFQGNLFQGHFVQGYLSNFSQEFGLVWKISTVIRLSLVWKILLVIDMIDR